MVSPLIVGAVSALISERATSASKEKEAEEKIELVKKLADLTPEQAQAVDAVKSKSVDEMRERVKSGVGPFGILPLKVSDRAREARERAREMADNSRKRPRRSENGRVHADDVGYRPLVAEGVKEYLSIHPITEAERRAVSESSDPKATLRKIVDARVIEYRGMKR